MKVIRAYIDTNYIDGDGNRTVYFLYDSDVKTNTVDRDISEVANEFFEDHEYLADGYDYTDGWDSKKDKQSYYDNCYYDWQEITKDEMMKEIKVEYGDVAEAEIHDYRIKEKE